MSHLFISYARSDDEPCCKKLVKDLTQQGFKVWWDRKAMESRGRTFLQEIRDAISAADRLILVVGPGAAKSDYVRVEWTFALEACKVIIPILRLGDYELVPELLSQLHCPDFRTSRPYEEALSELVRLMDDPVPPLATLYGVEALPPHFLPRPDMVDQLNNTVLKDITQPTVITSAKQTAALQGMGGIGKSVLAAAFSRACKTRRSFADGIVWIKLSQKPDMIACMRNAGQALGDPLLNQYIDLQSSQARLSEWLQDKNCLLILDDAWEVGALEIFINTLGPRCRLLVTTRDKGLTSAIGAQDVLLDVLKEEAALQLLADWSGQPVHAFPYEARSLAKECGNLPFALALCGAMIRDGNDWSDLLESLQETDLAYIEKQLPNYPYPDILRSMKISVDAFAQTDPAGARHYLELAVFPTGEAIPEQAILTLWSHTNGMKERHARKLLTILDSKALLRLQGTSPDRRVALHDLQHDYLQITQKNIPGLHKSMLASYKKLCPEGWHSGPNDGYFFDHLAYHLAQAGQEKGLKSLLSDLQWMKVRLHVSDVNSLLRDFRHVAEDQAMRLIRDAIELGAHVLAVHPEQLCSQLWIRLLPYTNTPIRNLLQQTLQEETIPWYRPLSLTQMPAGTPLVRTLKAAKGGSPTNTISVTADGTLAVSGDDYGMVRIWDVPTGVERKSVRVTDDWISCGDMHELKQIFLAGIGKGELVLIDLNTGNIINQLKARVGRINDVAISPNGVYAASGHEKGTLCIWNLQEGTCSQKIEEDQNSIEAVAWAADGLSVFTGGTGMQQWEVNNGYQLLRSFQTYQSKVESLATSPNGQLLAAGFNDGRIQLWDPSEKSEAKDLTGHTGLFKRNHVSALTFTPDNKKLISCSWDEYIRIWDVKTGQELINIKAHSMGIYDLDIYDNGNRVITTSKDSFIKIWDLKRPSNIQLAEGHRSGVDALAIDEQAQIAVSGSRDRIIKIWDLTTGTVIRSLKGHEGRELHEGWIEGVSIHHEKQQIFSVGKDGTLRTWDVKTGRALKVVRGDWNKSFGEVSISADGSKVISGSNNYPEKVLSIWTPTRQRKLRVIRGVDFSTATFSLNGKRVVTAGYEGIIHVIDMQTYKILATLKSPIATPRGRAEFGRTYITKIAVDEKGHRAIMGFRNGLIEVWDLEKSKVLHTLTHQTDMISALALTPDGRLALSASADSLCLWDTSTGKVIAHYFGDYEWASCAMSADARWVVAGDEDGNVHFLQLAGQL